MSSQADVCRCHAQVIWEKAMATQKKIISCGTQLMWDGCAGWVGGLRFRRVRCHQINRRISPGGRPGEGPGGRTRGAGGGGGCEGRVPVGASPHPLTSNPHYLPTRDLWPEPLAEILPGPWSSNLWPIYQTSLVLFAPIITDSVSAPMAQIYGFFGPHPPCAVSRPQSDAVRAAAIQLSARPDANLHPEISKCRATESRVNWEVAIRLPAGWAKQQGEVDRAGLLRRLVLAGGNNVRMMQSPETRDADNRTAVQTQKTVTAYFPSKQSLPFGFAENRPAVASPPDWLDVGPIGVMLAQHWAMAVAGRRISSAPSIDWFCLE